MISVHEAEKLSLQQNEQFRLAAKEVRFEASQRQEVYGWVERLLCGQEYARQGRRARGLLRRYLGMMTGLSRAQFTRLVGHYLETGQVRGKTSRAIALRRRSAYFGLLGIRNMNHQQQANRDERQISHIFL